jgi:DNA ligase-1
MDALSEKRAHAGKMRRVAGVPLLACWMACAALPGLAADRPAAPVMLANVYRGQVDLSDYWVSEKYDGVRAYWDGHALLTRAGNLIHAPHWFVAGWPQVPLDGELWIGRGQFEAVVSTVRDEHPDAAAWRRVRFMVFDLPAHAGPFTQRLDALSRLLSDLAVPWVRLVPQFKVADRAALKLELRQVVAAGGEGLMLHRGRSLYRAARSDDLLKLKPYLDAEARVIDHLPGKGKYRGMLGALLVQRPDGVQFRLGTGFTDEQRRHPPPIGSWVTYSYHSLTRRGIPRSARFMRIRDGMQPP